VVRLKYCKKCGSITYVSDTDTRRCFCCNSPYYFIPDEYLVEDKVIFKKGMEERFIKEVIEPSPELDPELYKNRDIIIANRHEESGLDRIKVRKIGAVSRMVSGSLFGLGSSKIGKQWHCNGCGSDF